MGRFSFSAPALVGLDIQPDSIRLVQLKKTRHGFLVEHVAAIPLPSPILMEGKIYHWDVLHAALGELVQALGIKGMAASIHLPARLVRMQQMQLPLGLSEAEIEAEIHTKMQRDLPGMTDALCIDFTLSTQKNRDYYDVFFTAARQQYLSDYTACINATGLRVKIVDVDMYALQRVVCFAFPPTATTNDVNAMVYVTNDMAAFVVFHAQKMIFYHHWDLSEATDFLPQLNSKIQLYLATDQQNTIHKLVVCGADHYFGGITNTTLPPWTVELCYPRPFARMTLASHLNAQFIAANETDFLMACGSALREVPVW
jgi:type IV pilus assembly protein PilM